ncbi:hypothetical protein Mal4_05320 [Maioricimonas rarisocia]|uniref:Uncharacterized protein n=1 Tax=Maioricimonas rarisocia TaxID=2528026 RepID=A0A517Z198_9PLAN|nr:hypothetical protein [Maioricimonas rarisocia]QDU36248.1 hypothetical protein Mal4_05320 [Maioricimonas rarisocia]
MPDVASALLVIAGAILIVASAVSTTLTDTARQRLSGMGILVGGLGLIMFLFAYVATMSVLL